MKKLNKILIAFSALAFAFFGCSNIAMDKQSDNVEYGSIIVNGSKALDINAITSATVTITGSGMKELSTTASVATGTGTFVFEEVPVGKNRIVTVKGNTDGAQLRAIVDVEAGKTNSVQVTWATTALGNVFHYLNKKGTDIGTISDISAIETAIKSAGSVHPVLVDAEKIAADYPNLKTGYVLETGVVEVDATGVTGYSVQVTDPASNVYKITADGKKEIAAYPGEWKLKVFDASTAQVEEKTVKVQAGLSTSVSITKGGKAPDDAIVVYVPKNNANGFTHIWAWTDSKNYTGGKWPGVKMDTVGSDYVYTIETTSCEVILNNGGNGAQTGDIPINSAGCYKWNGSSFEKFVPEGNGEVVVTVNNPKEPGSSLKIYVSADSAPTLWVHDKGGHPISENMGEAWPGDTMKPATGMNDSTGWYMKEIPEEFVSGDVINIHINSGEAITTGKTGTFWYDAKGVVGGGYSDTDPSKAKDPEAPSIAITPTTKVASNGAISVTYQDGYAQVKDVTVTLSGAVSKTYSLADFSGNTLSISLTSLGVKEGDAINVTASITNTVSTANASANLEVTKVSTDYFTWDNVNAYFVLTDRFANGDSSNDHSYYRKNGLSGDENVATFHGGDIKGLTQNMDYFKKLGINAIWITAPYEQAHGWVSGKDKKFPHYAFHGYYTLDWTFMDRNMGTIDEFRKFVQTCHENGIRVIMDIVMNHVGYNNRQDMITYNYGNKTSHADGWLAKVGGVWDANDSINESDWKNTSIWESWWGPWIRSFGYASGNEFGGSCGGLPDVKSEVSDTNIGIAPVLKTKWAKENNSSYDNWRVPAVANVDWWGKTGDWRKNKTARIVEYQCVWLSAWVREFGIDGFRCDTAKHVEPQYWGMLKDACTDALKKWRADPTKEDNSGAKEWDENFWMTGECWGWTAIGGGGEYYNQGKFDSMVNFSFNGQNSWDGNYRGNYPKADAWNSYLNINKNGDSDRNGNRDNVLTYISSHDTGLTRVGDQYEVGTGLVLLPGGVQIYYGDESNRQKAYAGCGDGDMMTRGDMNLNEAKTSGVTAHWGKVGNFRKYNPAVGAGTGSGTKRTYTGPAGDNKVAIGVNGASVDVSGLFTDGTIVYNWYDGKSATVSGGKVTFSGGSMKQPILVSDRNPADCGVTF